MTFLLKSPLNLRFLIRRSPACSTIPVRSYTCIRSLARPATSEHVVTRTSTSRHTNLFRARAYSSDSPTANIQPPDHLSDAEKLIFNKIKGELQPIRLEVQDISGGCGSMFGLDIVSPKFAGLSTIKQHQMVNRVLAEEIKGWHGMQLKTKAVE